MAQVYFSKEIDRILDKLDFSQLGKKVAIKLHFGEKGCTTFLNPEIARKVYKKVESFGKKATLIECNVLYRGSRTNSTEHIKTAREHGFVNMDIDILDGEMGDESIEINGCKIGRGIKKYDSIIVLSHFKGHNMAGFGGALKNSGMGLGSRAGKLHMHSTISPSISSKCIGCGTCVENCDVKAISIENGKAKINPDKCIGCAMCIAVCPEKAVSIPWQSESSSGLQKKIAEYSKAVLSLFNKTIFINVLENITSDCDCMGSKQVPAIENIGILAGSDIVSVEQASLDLANKQGFSKIQKHIGKQEQIDYAEKIGLGSKKYELVELD